MVRLVHLLILALLFAAPMAHAQSAWWLGGVAGGGSGQGALDDVQPMVAIPAPDYEEWTRFAATAEERIEALGTPSDELDRLRAALASWRERFLAAQDANRSRIETLRTQITALGPAPADGDTEPPEITARRAELTEQLSRLQAPGIAAEEAFRRSDGLIREIDRILRSRDTDELLRRSPSPLHPGNLFGALVTLSQVGSELVGETLAVWADPDKRAKLIGALPVILLFLAIALVSVLRVRIWIDRLTRKIQDRLPVAWGDVVAFPLSLGQVVLPVFGVALLLGALGEADVWGPITSALIGEGLIIGVTLAFVTLWIAAHVFPEQESSEQILHLAPERRAEGRLHLSLFALILLARAIVDSTIDPSRFGAVVSIIYFPLTVLSGLLLLRIGQLLRQSAANEIALEANAGFRPRLIALMGKAAAVLGLMGPVLAAVGYAGLGAMMVYPAMASLGLLAVVALVQRLVNNIYALVFGRGEGSADALIPVLINFALALATMPFLALFWGARWADILELWLRFREGFRLGETRVSPSDFVYFLVVFFLLYGLTRLLQSALKTSILPKTSLDAGGRNAIVAGVGYIGIFIAALAAITSTGLDLSSLAIVAGALSVGIGFGLQNIVSNFVSGIILLIERPVAEGDWIQAGGVQGRVKSISVRSTRIETFDRTDVIVPNADLISGTVTNWTGFNLTGRVTLPVGVAYGTDTRKVERILLEIAEEQPLVLLDPKPVVLFMGFGASSLDFELRVILRDINFGMAVRSEINHAIAARFVEEGIEIPFPQQDLWLRNPEVLHTPPPAKPVADLPEPAHKGPIAPDTDLMRDGIEPDAPEQA